uniref:Peptidase A2 domain-containing protein n=1 Tax=Scylla olivacea TaxID=85551 RepID=A0A0N7Z9Q8_SCYOL
MNPAHKKGEASGNKMETLNLKTTELGTEVTEESNIPQSSQLEVREGNRVWGLMNGKQCSFVLDSGTSKTFMFASLAKKLALDIGQKTDKEIYHLWIGNQKVEFITLKNVLITLEGGVNIRTPVRVLSEALERCYNLDDVVLDVHLLRRGAMIQAFWKSGSSLYIGEPTHLLQNSIIKDQDGVPSFWVQRANAGFTREMSVILDTGAENLYLSRHALNVLTDERNESKMPQRISIDMGDNHCLETEKVEFIEQEVVDLVMGVHLLHKYNAVVDYGNQTVTFIIRGKRFKIKFYFE